MTTLEEIKARAEGDHQPCTAEVCGSRYCRTARDRAHLIAVVEAVLERADEWEDSYRVDGVGNGRRVADDFRGTVHAALEAKL